MAVTRDWDAYWLAQVELVASMSTCLTRHVGAVIVRDRRSIATGFNGNVPGARHCNDGGCVRCLDKHALHSGNIESLNRLRLERLGSGQSLDICVCVHAEANAIAQCARYGASTAGVTVYLTTRPCLECVKLMAVAGVVEVVYDQDYPGDYEVPPTMTMRRFNS